MMRTISITSLLVLAVAACGCGAARPPVTPEPEPEPAHVTDLPVPGQPLWPASAPRVQVIVASSPDQTQSEIFVISGGTRLLAVYRVAAAGYSAAQARIASANPLFTVILHPGAAPRTLAPPAPPGGAAGTHAIFECPSSQCIYVPWTPPATGPIVPPSSVRLLLRFASALDAIHAAWASNSIVTPGATP